MHYAKRSKSLHHTALVSAAVIVLALVLGVGTAYAVAHWNKTKPLVKGESFAASTLTTSTDGSTTTTSTTVPSTTTTTTVKPLIKTTTTLPLTLVNDVVKPTTPSGNSGGSNGIPSTCDGQPVTIYGTSGDDVIHGTPGNDVIATGAGDDTIYGDGGNDIICSGEGNDLIYAGPGNDWIDAGDGNDIIYAGNGNDTIFAGPGDDQVFEGDGADYIDGGPGNDMCVAMNPGETTEINCESGSSDLGDTPASSGVDGSRVDTQ